MKLVFGSNGMKLSRRAFAGGALALGATTLSGCGYLFRGASWRQKLTLTAYTPDGEVTASSVSEVTVPGSNVRGRTTINGEALYADLGSGRSVFALMDHNLRYLVPRMFLGFSGANTEELSGGLDYGSLEGMSEVVSVPAEFSPKLVTFVSPKLPLSIRPLDAAQLDSFFGVGFGLKSLTIEVTEEPVTEGRIASVLSDEFFATWETLRQMPEGSKKHTEFKKSALSSLVPANFKRQAGA